MQFNAPCNKQITRCYSTFLNELQKRFGMFQTGEIII